MRINLKSFDSNPSLFPIEIASTTYLWMIIFLKTLQPKKKKRKKKKVKKVKFQEPLFVWNQNSARVNWLYNWEYEESKKTIPFEDYQTDIEKVARKLARSLLFDWRDLAHGEGFLIFEDIKRKWNPEINNNFQSWFYKYLKQRMIDRLRKRDIKQPGISKGRGKYFKKNINIGVGQEMEINSMIYFPEKAMTNDFTDEILDRYDRN